MTEAESLAAIDATVADPTATPDQLLAALGALFQPNEVQFHCTIHQSQLSSMPFSKALRQAGGGAVHAGAHAPARG